MDFSSFTTAEQTHMTKVIEKRQMLDFLKLYARITQNCFASCVNDFTSKSASTKEKDCVLNCVDKFVKHSERVGARFSELNAEIMSAQP